MSAGGPDGFLPRMPASVPGVDPSLAGLSIAGPADAGPFRVEGARACASGHQRSPVGRVEFYGIGVVDDFRMGVDRAANLVVFPGMTRRDFIGRDGLYVETIVVAPDLPLVVVSRGVAAHHGPTGAFSFRLALCDEACGPGASADPIGSDGGDMAALVGPDGTGVAVGIVPAPGVLEVSREGESCARITVKGVGSGPVSLVLAGGSAREVRTAFSAAGHLGGHSIRAATGPADGGLATLCGLAGIDDGVGWLRVRVHRALDRLAARGSGTTGEPGVRDASLMLGLAAIAVGDRPASELALDLPHLAHTPERAILAGRHASSFGDGTCAAEIARQWEDQAVVSPGDSAFESDPEAGRAMWALAGRLLADGLLYAATDEVRARLLQPPRIPETEIERRAPTRALPMARPATRVTRAAVLEALLNGEPVPDEGLVKSPGTFGLPGRFRRDPTSAWVEWRRRVLEGLEEGPAGPASWHEAGNEPVAAHLVLALTHGMLGLAVDAPAGRVRLAPRLPSHLTSFAVNGLTVGDVTFALAFERAGNQHTFSLRPEHAPVPPFVVFEAAVPGGPGKVLIDGTAAELEPRMERGSTVYPLQFALDAPRTVEIVPGEPLERNQPSTTM